MKILRIAYLSLLLSLICTAAFGQLISGSIVDKDDSNPIAFAHVLVEGTQMGTVANQEGKFELNITELPDEFSLIISVIGYKTTQITYSKAKDESPLNIQLEESVLELPEVVITYISAERVLDDFHKNYNSNYHQESTLAKAYYHSTLSENGEFKHLLESTINIQEFNKNKHRAFEVEMTQRRKSNDYRLERWAEKNNYLYDAIASNPMLELSDFLDKKNLKYYGLKRLPNTSYNDEVVFVIQFTPKKGAQKPLYQAKAYFNADDFALIKAEYDFRNDSKKIKDQSLKDRTYHTPFISGSIQYQKVGERYAQKYLSYSNGWTVINNVSGDTLAKDVLRDEILFLETQEDHAVPLSSPLSRWGDIYKKPFPYDAAYWNNQVKIPPTQLFQQAIEDLEKHQRIEVQFFNHAAQPILDHDFGHSIGGKVDSVLTIYHLTQLFNGVALVSHQGKIIHHKAYGFENLENELPLDTSSVFDIGSITKQFTTTIILKLREEGKLKLEDKIANYLPDYRYANEITIHQLMAHRSGIPTFDYDQKLEDSKWFREKMDARELITSFCSNELEFIPGSRMEYSNSNFLVLSAIIEEVSGKDYYTVLNEYILHPLELHDSYSPDSIPAERVAKGYMLAGDTYLPEPEWIKSNMKGGGCVYSTSTDLLRWINATNSTELLNAEDKALIKSPISYYEYYDADFGYSWAINKTTLKTSSPAYFYGGTSLGFFSMVTSLPESETTLILLSNTGDFPRIELTNEILRILESGGN